MTSHVSNSSYPELKGPLKIVGCESISTTRSGYMTSAISGSLVWDIISWVENGPKKCTGALTLPQRMWWFDFPKVQGKRGGGDWHKASVVGCLSLAAPIGLSPLHILTLCGSECVLVVSTEPLDDLSCLTTPGLAVPDGLLPVPGEGGGVAEVRTSTPIGP